MKKITKIMHVILLSTLFVTVNNAMVRAEKDVESIVDKLRGQFKMNQSDIEMLKTNIPKIDFAEIIDVKKYGIEGTDSLFRAWLSRLDGIMAMCAQTRMAMLQPIVRGDDFVPFFVQEQIDFLRNRKADLGEARVSVLESDLNNIIELEDTVVLKINELLTFMSKLISEQKAKAESVERERLKAMEIELERSRVQYSEQLNAAEKRRGKVSETKEKFEMGVFVTFAEPAEKKEAEKVKGDVSGVISNMESRAAEIREQVDKKKAEGASALALTRLRKQAEEIEKQVAAIGATNIGLDSICENISRSLAQKKSTKGRVEFAQNVAKVKALLKSCLNDATVYNFNRAFVLVLTALNDMWKSVVDRGEIRNALPSRDEVFGEIKRSIDRKFLTNEQAREQLEKTLNDIFEQLEVKGEKSKQ